MQNEKKNEEEKKSLSIQSTPHPTSPYKDI
jgi:hypothetical protein